MVTGGHDNHCKVEFNMHVISHIFRPALSMIICHNFKKANRKPFDQVSILIPPFAFHFSKNETQITLDDVRAAVGKVPPPPRGSDGGFDDGALTNFLTSCTENITASGEQTGLLQC